MDKKFKEAAINDVVNTMSIQQAKQLFEKASVAAFLLDETDFGITLRTLRKMFQHITINILMRTEDDATNEELRGSIKELQEYMSSGIEIEDPLAAKKQARMEALKDTMKSDG